MKKLLCFGVVAFCAAAWSAEPAVLTEALVPAATPSAPVFPSEAERNEQRERLARQRQQLEEQYKQEAKLCYQNFDVTRCRLDVRDRRIQADAALRKEEIRFNAMERQIQAQETRRSVAELIDERNREPHRRPGQHV